MNLETSKRDLLLKIFFGIFGISAIGILLYAYDWQILLFIQDHLRNGLFDFIVPIYTSLCDGGILWIAIAIVMLPFKKYRKCGILILAALLLNHIICNEILKDLVARPRPYTLRTDYTPLVEPLKSFSFPSGHSATSSAAAFVIFLHHKKLGIVSIVLAVLMCLSRLYIFVHFPTDVFFGFVLGMICAYTVCLIQKKLAPVVLEKIHKKN